MQLLKPIVVTLADNLLSNRELKDSDLIGQAVIGWIEIKQIQDETGEIKQFPQVMLGVVWENRTLTPALSIYRNEELASLGLPEEFEINEEVQDDDEDDGEYEQGYEARS